MVGLGVDTESKDRPGVIRYRYGNCYILGLLAFVKMCLGMRGLADVHTEHRNGMDELRLEKMGVTDVLGGFKLLPTHRHYLILSRLKAATFARSLDYLRLSTYKEGAPDDIDDLIGWVHISVKIWCEEVRTDFVNNRK